MPMAKEPMMPVRPCTTVTSRASSTRSFSLRIGTPKKEKTPSTTYEKMKVRTGVVVTESRGSAK